MTCNCDSGLGKKERETCQLTYFKLMEGCGPMPHVAAEILLHPLWSKSWTSYQPTWD